MFRRVYIYGYDTRAVLSRRFYCWWWVVPCPGEKKKKTSRSKNKMSRNSLKEKKVAEKQTGKEDEDEDKSHEQDEEINKEKENNNNGWDSSDYPLNPLSFLWTKRGTAFSRCNISLESDLCDKCPSWVPNSPKTHQGKDEDRDKNKKEEDKDHINLSEVRNLLNSNFCQVQINDITLVRNNIVGVDIGKKKFVSLQVIKPMTVQYNIYCFHCSHKRTVNLTSVLNLCSSTYLLNDLDDNFYKCHCWGLYLKYWLCFPFRYVFGPFMNFHLL